ncbi:prepilin-type N-terminal cleavage/methylation domain-containing protein [Deinococcus yunweiensis]|uniref:prepilin-type N-terminal cleavage/methylation domain-containing protein n=1 Tax=Deinococcus yunweiensis TaxID=367282 RepID=UPI00398F1FD3
MGRQTEARVTRGRRLRGAHAGFTIIEILVTIALLSVIVLVVLTPLTGFFGMTRRSNDQVTATQITQRALETIRGEWLSVARYDQRCVKTPLPTTFPPLDIQITNLDPDGQNLGSVPWRGECDAAAPLSPPDRAPLRRVQVTRSDDTGRVLSQLTVLVDRP